MQNDFEHSELVRQAAAGDRESIAALADLAQVRVRAYVRRVILNEDRAQDITQEAMVAMLSSLGQLRDPLRFWPWVFTIASNKVRQSFRRADLHPMGLSDIEDTRLEPRSEELEPAEGLSRLELVELTRNAMEDLDVRYRMVLAMRFYEDMPHAAISHVLGCSEMTARVTFLRAKRALVRALRKRGVVEPTRVPGGANTLASGGALVAALIAFGESTRAATASPLQLSAPALREGVFRLLACKQLTALAAAVLLTMLLWAPPAPATRSASPPPPLGIHYTELSLSSESTRLPFKGTRSQGAYEQWYQFPEGAGGPFNYRMQRWDPWVKGKLCFWIQNDSANYYIHAGKKNTVHINNARIYHTSLRVETLPTDPEDFVNFIAEIEADATSPSPPEPGADTVTVGRPAMHSSGVVTHRDPKTGFLSGKSDHRFPELGPFETRYEYGQQPPGLFDAPVGAQTIDERDEMHRRGWTYVRVSGHVGARSITGKAQIPFSYSAYQRHRPWLQLELEGQLRIVDTQAGASLARFGGTTRRVAHYASGTFFHGLLRPWSGFHTIDVIRRDAAARRVRFETQALNDGEFSLVRLMDHKRTPPAATSYRIDMNHDVIEQIVFVSQGDAAERGVITFEYLQNVDGLDGEFETPTVSNAKPGVTNALETGPLWPVLLLE